MITTHIIVVGAADAARWYTEVLGAEEKSRITLPDGRLIHVELWFGPSVVMVADKFPEHDALSPATTGCTSAVLYLQTSDVDAVWARALEGGAQVVRPLAETFWGEREGQITYPFGHRWGLSEHVRDVSLAEMSQAAVEVFGGSGPGQRPDLHPEGHPRDRLPANTGLRAPGVFLGAMTSGEQGGAAAPAEECRAVRGPAQTATGPSSTPRSVTGAGRARRPPGCCWTGGVTGSRSPPRTPSPGTVRRRRRWQPPQEPGAVPADQPAPAPHRSPRPVPDAHARHPRPGRTDHPRAR